MPAARRTPLDTPAGAQTWIVAIAMRRDCVREVRGGGGGGGGGKRGFEAQRGFERTIQCTHTHTHTQTQSITHMMCSVKDPCGRGRLIVSRVSSISGASQAAKGGESGAKGGGKRQGI